MNQERDEEVSNPQSVVNNNGLAPAHSKHHPEKEVPLDADPLEPPALPQEYDPAYFPDGGARAWLALVGGMLVVFATWGITSSFGVFTAYYKQELLPTTSAFRIGWINSVQTSFIFYGGTLSGKLFDAGYFYHLEIVGMAVSFVTFILVAECTEYWQVLLSQGVGMGLGMGMLFGPALACTGAYFKRYRPFAMSVCACGGGLGGAVFPIVANNLLPKVGFKWTVRVLAFIDLALFIIIALMVRDRIPRAVRRQRLANSAVGSNFFALNSWVDVTVFKDPIFILFTVGSAFCFLCLYPPYSFLQSFAVRIDASESLVKYIVAVLGAMSFLGRFSCFLLAKAVGPLNSMTAAMLLTSITLFSWAAVKNERGLIAFAIVYGFLSGVSAAAPPFIVPQLSHDVSRLGVRFGMVFSLLGTAVLLSIPMGGLVLGTERYKPLAYFCGGSMMTAAVFLMACVAFKLRDAFKNKPLNLKV